MDNNFVSTINLSVNFLKPIPSDTDVLVKVYSSSQKNNIVNLVGEIYLADSRKLACTSVGTYIILKGKPMQIKPVYL